MKSIQIETNYPVSLDDAVKSISAFNCEAKSQTLARNPRMVSDNVLEDDEDIYLLPQPRNGRIMPYLIPKERLGENWGNHLREKAWCDTQMLGTFCRLQKAWLKKNTRK